MGGAFGFMLGGPLGALLGASLGHQFDKGLKGMPGEGPDAWAPGATERVQSAFFTTTFAVMGHLAKADGRVSREEIALAADIMTQMQLSPDMVQAAQGLFREGKAADFELDPVLGQFRRECHGRLNLMRMFLEIQLHAAYADGRVDAAERRLLGHICESLGFPHAEFDRLEQLVRAARGFAPGAAAAAGSAGHLADAYEVLGVDSKASDTEVKKAYRRLMNQHHPDKLVSKGLPEEMMKLATEKTREIKAAYDTVRAARKAAAG